MVDTQCYGCPLFPLLWLSFVLLVNTDMTNDGRIDNNLKIDTEDLAKSLDFIRSLSSAAAINSLAICCKIMDLEKQS